jgi:hypothetical protein
MPQGACRRGSSVSSAKWAEASIPIINVPAAKVLGMPMGISFIGTAFSEPTLIKLASGFEAVTHARFPPTFAGNITTAHTSGTTLAHPPKVNAPTKKQPQHL